MRRFQSRGGKGNLLLVLVVGSLLVAGGLLGLLAVYRAPQGDAPDKLVMFCAAGLRVPVEEIAAAYFEEYHVKVEFQYGGSQSLLGQLEVNRQTAADLYLAGDDFYTDLAREKGLAAETIPIATMHPVIVVAKGNPKRLSGPADLLRADVRVALGSPDQAAIGKATRRALKQIAGPADDTTDLWERLKARVTESGVFKPTVNEVANDVKLGAVDAGIVWDSTAAMPKYRDEVDMVSPRSMAAETSVVTVAILKSTQAPTAALRFARYLTASDRGLGVFKHYGLTPVEGDLWAPRPEITFFCGAVNRRAVERVIAAFETREGCKVNTVYNGCGILTSQMGTINDQGSVGFPDTYMACDRYYLENVRQWFQEDVDISEADIVIAVPKGNPRNIRSLDDLKAAGVRVAVGQPQQCTIGALTRTLLEKEGVTQAVMKNVVTQTTSSSLLVPAVTTGQVDAAIAYVTDTQAAGDRVDTVRIDSPHAKAVQPFSIATRSRHKALGRRLFQAVAAAKDAFESAGFHFRLSPAQTQPAKNEEPVQP